MALVTKENSVEACKAILRIIRHHYFQIREARITLIKIMHALTGEGIEECHTWANIAMADLEDKKRQMFGDHDNFPLKKKCDAR